MKELILQFDDQETTLERLTSQAGELGMTPEQWVHRAIAGALGDYGLREVPKDFKATTLTELFVASGVLKPRN